MKALLLLLAACGRIGFAPVSASDDAGIDGSITPHGHWRSVVVGARHVCAITDANALWCWGDDYYSQVGLGTNLIAVPPTQIGTASWQTVALGSEVTCGIQADATLWCWGTNGYGELGFGAQYEVAPVPTQVDASSWKAIALGNYSVCGLHTDDTLWCWGRNERGELGDNSTTDLMRPTRIGLGQFTELSTSVTSACAIDELQHAACWGAGDGGQLGDGTSTDRSTPTAVAGSHTWSAIALGTDHTCAVEVDGTPWCWGVNYQGQLGHGDTNPAPAPQQVTGPALAMVSLGAFHSCGLDASGGAWCWGNTERGQLGTLTGLDAQVPVRIADATAISAGGSTTCYIDPAADLWCSGNNAYGQTGQPIGEVHTPVQADARTDWNAIFAHDGSLCGSTIDQRTWCWGVNYDGEVGDATYCARQEPVAIGNGFSGIAIGQHATMGIMAGAAWAWGYDGQFDTPVPASLGANASAVAVGALHHCRINGGVLTCGGDDTVGQLGDGMFGGTRTVDVAGGPWRLVRTRDDSTCGIAGVPGGRGIPYCWGDNQSGALGFAGAKSNTPVMLALAPPLDTTDLGLGLQHGCALVSGQIWCWGDNTYGELGDGGNTASVTPQRMGTGTAWIALAVGDFHSCAIQSDHTLWCWGHADEGQLGLPLVDAQRTPRQLTPTADWLGVATGTHTTCGIKLDGTRWCTGFNEDGEQGDQHAWQTEFLRLP